MRISKRAATFCALTVFLASCSSDGDNPGFGPGASPDTSEIDQGSPTGEISSGSEAELEAAARASFLAVLSADNQLYFNSLSLVCRNLEFAAVGGHLDGRRFNMTGLGGIELSALGVSAVAISRFEGSSATVTLTISGSDEQFAEELPRQWIHEDGSWKLDECAEVTPSRGQLEGFGTDRSDPMPFGSVADIGGWLVSLSFVNADSAADVLDLGGVPTSDGERMVVAQMGFFYNGTQPSAILGDGVAFAMVNGDQIYDDETACVGDSQSDIFLDRALEAGPGEDLAPMWVCRIVPSDDAGEMLLRATDVVAGTEYWFDLSGS